MPVPSEDFYYSFKCVAAVVMEVDDDGGGGDWLVVLVVVKMRARNFDR